MSQRTDEVTRYAGLREAALAEVHTALHRWENSTPEERSTANVMLDMAVIYAQNIIQQFHTVLQATADAGELS